MSSSGAFVQCLSSLDFQDVGWWWLRLAGGQGGPTKGKPACQDVAVARINLMVACVHDRMESVLPLPLSLLG